MSYAIIRLISRIQACDAARFRRVHLEPKSRLPRGYIRAERSLELAMTSRTAILDVSSLPPFLFLDPRKT